MAFEPDTFFPKYLKLLDDVAEHRSRLRGCIYSDFAIEHLSSLLWDTIQRKRRKNLIYGLQAIKWILKNREGTGTSIDSTTVDRLFELYQHFVFDRLNDIRWCISVILRDKPLRPSQVRWLVEHQAESEHIVNRLLRYPRFDPVIADWARETLQRRSELLGRLIVDSLPPEARRLSPPTVLWAIYYSSAPIDVKDKLLVKCTTAGSVDDVIEICLRLNRPTVLHELRHR